MRGEGSTALPLWAPFLTAKPAPPTRVPEDEGLVLQGYSIIKLCEETNVLPVVQLLWAAQWAHHSRETGVAGSSAYICVVLTSYRSYRLDSHTKTVKYTPSSSELGPTHRSTATGLQAAGHLKWICQAKSLSFLPALILISSSNLTYSSSLSRKPALM